MSSLSFTPVQESSSQNLFEYRQSPISGNEIMELKNILFASDDSFLSREVRTNFRKIKNISNCIKTDLGICKSAILGENLDNFSINSDQLFIFLNTQPPIISKGQFDVGSTIDNRVKSTFGVKSNHLGQQRHLIDQEVEVFHKLSLGALRHSTEVLEPILRDSNGLHFNLNSIRKSDCTDAHSVATGLYAEEACQIMRYAGESDKLNFIEISASDCTSDDAMLIATMIWYVIEGYQYRVTDNPFEIPSAFDTYLVEYSELEESLEFYRHKSTNKWWIKALDEKNSLIACSQLEYDNAINGNLSNRLLQSL